MKKPSWWEPDDDYDPDSEPVTKTYEYLVDEYMKQHHPDIWRWMKDGLTEKEVSYNERKREFREDGSCTNKCQWGYGIVIATGLCIALPQCKKEFVKDELHND